jgi:hypothetical protein
MDFTKLPSRKFLYQVIELMDVLATFGIFLLISFTRKKVCTRRDFGIKAFSNMGPNLQLSICGRIEVV